MPIQIGDAVDFHANKGIVCCINSFTQLGCVQFEDGDCVCVPLQALTPSASTTAVCTSECAKKCSGA